MRPIRLTMQAFGPYQEQEIVDFTELGPNRVFLIHGDTGSGKTTILDAMVFGLYGETSGGERRPDQMRCDAAPADLPTEVTFDFSLGSASLRVRRRPAQELVGARGARVSKPAEATLWDRTGCTDEQEGRPLTTKITEANALDQGSPGFLVRSVPSGRCPASGTVPRAALGRLRQAGGDPPAALQDLAVHANWKRRSLSGPRQCAGRWRS